MRPGSRPGSGRSTCADRPARAGTRRGAWGTVAACALFCLALAPVPTAGHAERSRYRELRSVIDRNTGFAHFTRGVNMYTLVALRGCVSERDIPVLTQMLQDRDYVTRFAAARVLADMGDEGKRALGRGLEAATDARTRELIEEALREAESPTRRPIADYPLSERERRAIRGCSKTP